MPYLTHWRVWPGCKEWSHSEPNKECNGKTPTRLSNVNGIIPGNTLWHRPPTVGWYYMASNSARFWAWQLGELGGWMGGSLAPQEPVSHLYIYQNPRNAREAEEVFLNHLELLRRDPSEEDVPRPPVELLQLLPLAALLWPPREGRPLEEVTNLENPEAMAFPLRSLGHVVGELLPLNAYVFHTAGDDSRALLDILIYVRSWFVRSSQNVLPGVGPVIWCNPAQWIRDGMESGRWKSLDVDGLRGVVESPKIEGIMSQLRVDIGFFGFRRQHFASRCWVTASLHYGTGEF
ncbi:uncharacterized protein EV422DRAFT_503413 [Fimicolochytrium jonesii]|uniref:uncharacterized protein n=1 Tax=Fimicolochytrium jonesii TaxID=1396493 RepID=UPI0022FEFABA|nr:uncharacterized protein EV422DRAFT_503413 [Fimicolochytrium jonesii]KAI8826089.1 hypothetical protein EV422DRAFT_503413 [Fimicolochytrium jonesii]